MTYISYEKFDEIEKKYLSSPALSEEGISEISKLYRDSTDPSAKIIDRLLIEIINNKKQLEDYRIKSRELGDKFAEIVFKKS
jgi:hypothetical protein